MVKIKISPTRFAEACSILEYLAVSAGNKDLILSLVPRFVLDKDGEYVVQVKYDDDGDITGFENGQAALLAMSGVTPKRLEKLIDEFREAARQIVNPTSGGDLNGPTSITPEQPPPGSR